MTETTLLVCDGCGRKVSSEHISRRLRRLEQTTRFRPVHISTVFLGAVAPAGGEFLYATTNDFIGEARAVLERAGVNSDGKPAEVALAEFQRAGCLLIYVVECAGESTDNGKPSVTDLIERRMPSVITRIRRSLKPKRVVIIDEALERFVPGLAANLQCPVLIEAKNSRVGRK